MTSAHIQVLKCSNVYDSQLLNFFCTLKQWKHLWFLNTAFQNNNTQMHVSSYTDSCIMEKYLHIHLAVSWRYRNKCFMHFWPFLNRTQYSIGNFTGCFHNKHTSGMIWCLTEILSLLPKFNYIIIISRIPFGYVQAYFSFYDSLFSKGTCCN